MTFALRRNGRTLLLSNRYRGSRTAISPSFVCQRSFFYLGGASEVVDEFLVPSLRQPLRPPLHRLPPQMPHLLEDPLFGRVRLLEISLRVLYGADYRRESISKIRVLLEKCPKLLVAEFRRRHLRASIDSSNRQRTAHHFESHPPASTA